MNPTEATNLFKQLLRDILISTNIGLGKVMGKFIYYCVIAIATIRGRVNFLQLMRYSNLNEKTFRNNFAKTVKWVELNTEIALKELSDAAHRVIAIDPAHISKAGKCTAGIGKYWSGVAQAAKRGLEIMAIAAIDFAKKRTVMLGAQQTILNKNKSNNSSDSGDGSDNEVTMLDYYIQTIKNNVKTLLKISQTIVADAFFSRKPFVDAMVEMGFTFVSRLASNCVLKYLPNKKWLEQRGIKRGKQPKYAGRVDTSAPNAIFLDKVDIEKAKEAWTGIVWSNALKRDIRIVIVRWDKDQTVVYFSTKTDMNAKDIVAIYRSRFQIEFGIRDSRQFTGLHHSQARDEARLSFAFNISFFARNVLQTEVDRYYPKNSVGQLKKAVSDTEFALRILETVYPKGINEHTLNKIDHMIASYVGAVA